jgi:O-methyltransferase involved in polyketide biosynthesis
VDFEKDDLESALRHAGFDINVTSVAIWEGVVSYLTPAAVDQNFRMLARILAQGSQLIVSYVHQGALDGSVTFLHRGTVYFRLRSRRVGGLLAPARLPSGPRCLHR